MPYSTEYLKEMYAMYLRKSRKDMELEAMGEGETLARHHARLMALAARHDIHPDQIVVYKEMVSADSLDERPEMLRLLNDVYAKKYKGVLVTEIERLARGNTREQGEVADAFYATNTTIISESKVYDPECESDQTFFEFGLFMSRQEYKTINRRQIAGKHQSVREGNYLLPQRVFGYKIVKKSKKERTLEIIPEEAKLVQMIFDWYTEDRRSTDWIAQQLTRMGIQTIKKKPEWHRGTIRDMLDNPVFIGKVTWGKSRMVKEYNEDLGKLVKVRKNNCEREIYEGKHTGIISEEQFQKAQLVTESYKNPSLKVNTELINPLAGLLECCDCGRNMIANKFGNGKATRLKHADTKLCKKKSLPLQDVIDAFVDALVATIADLELKMETDDNTAEVAKHQAQLDAMTAELAKLERKLKKVHMDYHDDFYTRDEFIEWKQYYSQKIEEIKKQIQEAQEAFPEPVDYAEQIVKLHEMIECVKDPDITAKKKNDFLKQFIDRVTYDAIDYGRNKGGKVILEVFLK